MIKLAILSLLVLGCVHAAPVAAPVAPPVPNPVCAMIAFAAPAAKCAVADDAHLVKVEIDSGVKYCWPSYTQDGYGCATYSLSKAEAAQVAVQHERERAKQEAEAKAEADKAKSAEPTKPETTKALVPPVAKTTIPVKGAPKP